MDEEIIRVAILYGSQTGTAQDLAERMTRQAIQLKLRPRISCLDSYNLEQLPEEDYVIFIVSTTGQGDEPDNMKKFWKLLCRRNCKPIFTGRKYCSLGLGDSSYVKYNFVAKKLHKRVNQLGGIPIVPLELADDQHDLGIDAVVPKWIHSVWKSILGGIDVQNLSGVIEPKFKIVEEVPTPMPNGNEKIENGIQLEITASGTRLNHVLTTKRVTSQDHFQDVRFIEISSKNLTYEPGDVLVVQPSNSDENVSFFFELFTSLDPSQTFTLVPQYDWVSVPTRLEELMGKPLTWSKVVRHYLDIQSVPSRSFFEYLKHFSTNELEKEKLTEFCTAEGQDDLYKYCFKPKRSILEVLLDFPHTTKDFPVDYIFDLIPFIKPRSFSIASYSSETVGILVAVVEYKTMLKKPRLGLCSNWIARLNVDDIIPCWVTKGSFTFPPVPEPVPVIMIGPGTGCAPFNSLVSHRVLTESQNRLYLFFGCRFSSKDYFFEETWTRLVEQGKLHLFVAFSRDPDSKHVYVQHQIRNNAKLIHDLIVNQDAKIYIAGNAKRMPIDVHEAISTALHDNGIDNADALMKELVRHGRYQTEVWA